MFEIEKFTDYNDPYYLMKYYDEHDFECYYDKLSNVTNHNSLNYIFIISQKCANRKPWWLLRRNCVVNNISKPMNIQILCGQVANYNTYDVLLILDVLFENKFYDMLIIVFKNKVLLDLWFNSFLRRRYHNDDIIDIIPEIDFMIKKNIMTPKKIYYLISDVSSSKLTTKYSLLLYISKNYNMEKFICGKN
jgi:hypothetical protein